MRRAHPTRTALWVAAVISAGGLLMPWLRGPEQLPRAYVEAAEELGSGTRTVLGPADFLWLDFSQLAEAMQDPFSGANLWTLFVGLRSSRERPSAAEAHGAELLVRSDLHPAGAYVLLLCPMLVLGLSLLGTRDMRGSSWMGLAAVLTLAIYCLGRWRIAATEGARAAAAIEIGLGVWFTLFAALVAGIAFLMRWFFPKTKWL